MHIQALIAQRRGIKPLLLLLLLIAAALASGPAAADDTALQPDAVLEAGHRGTGYIVLNAIFGTSVLQHMYPPPGDINVTGSDNGMVPVIAAFFAKIAFFLFIPFASIAAVKGLKNGLEGGQMFSEGAGSAAAIRWTSGVALAFPMPHLYGMALMQKLIIVLAVASNGLANQASELVTAAAFDAPLGQDAVGGGLYPLPPNPDIDAPAEVAMANLAARESCGYHARTIGLSSSEVQTICQTAVTSSAGEAWAGSGKAENCNHIDSDYGKKLCETTRYALNDFRSEYASALDLDSESERVEAVKNAQFNYWQKLKEMRMQHDTALRGQAGGDTLDPKEHQLQLIKTVGWPGLGMSYNTLAEQVRAAKTIIENEQGETFSLDAVPDNSRTGEQIRIRIHNSLAEYKASEALNQNQQSWGANFEQEPRGLYEKTIAGLGDFFDATAAYVSLDNISSGVNLGASAVANAEADFLMGFFTKGSALEATYDMAQNMLIAMAGAAFAYDVGNAVVGITPTGLAAKTAKKTAAVAARSGASAQKPGLLDKLTSISAGPGASDTITGSAAASIAKMAVMLIGGLCFVIAMLLPKVPALLVAIMVIDWAVTLLIIFIAAPLWIVSQLSTSDNDLIAHQVKQGARQLAWVIIYPTLIVAGVVISIIIVNLAIPLAAGMVLSMTSGGTMNNVFFIISVPFVLIISIALICILSFNLIVKVPDMMASFIGLQPFGNQMITDALGYIGINRHVDSIQSKTNIGNLRDLR